MSFESLGLRAELLRAVSENGYSVPTPIQQQAIPLILEGRDLMGGAQTGTGTLNEVIGSIDQAAGEITVTSVDGTVRLVGSGDPIFQGDVIVTDHRWRSAGAK